MVLVKVSSCTYNIYVVRNFKCPLPCVKSFVKHRQIKHDEYFFFILFKKMFRSRKTLGIAELHQFCLELLNNFSVYDK